MKNHYLSVLFFCLFFLVVPGYSQKLLINEVMSSNDASIVDEDGEYSDWIELYNPGNADVNLNGYGLSDNMDNPFKWIFPNVSLPAGGYLVVWASGKDKTDVAGNLHSNFSISADGEIILLSDPNSTIVDQVDSIPIPTDITYGRKPGENIFTFLSISTPGSANSTESNTSVLTEPLFSHTGGVYPDAFDLTISSTEPGVTIIYTLDGSEPDPANTEGTTYSYKNTYPEGEILTSSYNSSIYSGPIHIENRTVYNDSMTGKSSTFDRVPVYIPDTPVYKGMVVRARAIKDGALPGPVATNTYFVNKGQKYTLPVVSMAIQEDLLFDYEKGIYTAGKDFDDWRASNRFGRADGASPANYQRTTEYPAHIEIFETNQERVLSQNIGFRLHGGHSRVHPQKSLRLYARGEYGKSEMKYKFFPDQPYNSYKRMLLRNSGNDWNYTLFRDASIQSIMDHMNFETQAFRPAILFINAEYWGIQSFTERYDKHYFERKYGIDPENIDYLTINSKLEVEEGDSLHYKETLKYIEDNGLADKNHYEYIQTRVDVENFIDYQIAQIFVGNADWPANNVKMWRTKNEYNPTAGKGKDGRWQWLMYDTDYSLGIYGGSFTRDNLTFATSTTGPTWPNPPWSTFLLRKFLENENFKIDFINRFTDQLNSSFKPEFTTAKINAIKKIIAPEIEEHIERWKQPDTLEAWEGHVEVMLKYVTERPTHQREHIRDYFNLGNDYQLTVNVADTTQGYVIVNKLALLSGEAGMPAKIYPWSGVYYAGVPIQLLAVAAPGYKFIRWSGGIDSLSPQVTMTPDGNISVEAIFEKKPETSVIHYWNFNNTSALTEVSYTVSEGNLYTKAEADTSEFVSATGNGFFGENSYNGDAAASHLRINNPVTAELIFNLPTVGFSQIVFQYETRRSTQGAAEQIIEYTLDGTTYQEKEVIMVLDDVPELHTFDFSEIKGVENNTNFGIRIRFVQGSGGGIAGNNRIDNVSLRGVPLEANAVKKGLESKMVVESYPNPFHNETQLNVTLINSTELKVTLMDMKGNIWLEIPETSMAAGTHEILINTGKLIPGVYFIVCTSGEYQSQLKMIRY